MTEEEIEELEKKLKLLNKEDFVYTWTNKEKEAVEKLLEENKELKEELEYQKELRQIEIYKLNDELKEQEEINKEHQKINGNLRKKIKELEEKNKRLMEDLTGKTIHELGTSDLYNKN